MWSPSYLHFTSCPSASWLNLQSHGERRQMNKGCWWGGDRGGFNLFGPRLAARLIRLPALSVCSCEVPSSKCNQREAREVRDVLGQRETEGKTSLSLSLFIYLQCVYCNRLDHKLGEHPSHQQINQREQREQPNTKCVRAFRDPSWTAAIFLILSSCWA